jgi:hypothetical protein
MNDEIKFYMGNNEEKSKSHKDSVELRILYFIWVLGASYYQGGYIVWVGEVQNIKIYPTTKNSCQARHIQPLNRIPETLAAHVLPSGQTCLTPLPYLDSRDLTQTYLVPSLNMSDLLALFWVNQAYPAPRPSSKDISQTCPT